MLNRPFQGDHPLARYLGSGPYKINTELQAYITKNRSPIGKLLLKPKFKGVVAVYLSFDSLFKYVSDRGFKFEAFQKIMLSELDDNVRYEFITLVRVNSHNIRINNYRRINENDINERRKIIVSRKLAEFVTKEKFRVSEFAMLF